MTKFLLSAAILAALVTGSSAQGLEGGSILESSPTAISGTAARAGNPTESTDEADKDKPKEGETAPTEITSTKEASFDQKTRTAVFEGSVNVKDAQFFLKCDKLTAILRDPDAPKTAQPAASPTPDSGKNVLPAAGAGGLEKAIAEGNVEIIADRPGEKEGEKTRYAARARRAEFDNKSGQMKLIGSPQVRQGINTHIATEDSTVMIIGRDGRMITNGRSKTVIQEEPQHPSKRQ